MKEEYLKEVQDKTREEDERVDLRNQRDLQGKDHTVNQDVNQDLQEKQVQKGADEGSEVERTRSWGRDMYCFQ